MLKLTDVPDLLGSNCPVISVDCPAAEEVNVIQYMVETVEDACVAAGVQTYQFYFWTFGQSMTKIVLKEDEESGIRGLDFEAINVKPQGFNPAADTCFILDQVEQMDIKTESGKAIFILADINKLISQNPHDLPVTRRIKSLALSLEQTKKRLFLIGQGIEIPQEFSELIEEIKVELPNLDEVKIQRDETVDFLTGSQDIPVNLTPEEDENFTRSLQGFTLQAIQKNLRLGIRKYQCVDSRIIEFMQSRKIEKLEKLNVQFSPPPDVEIAGLQEFQEWIDSQTKLFSKNARRYNITPPKGVVLVGVPGTGKSLAAKTIGWQWKIPILSLNIGSVLQGIVGSSEKNFRDILAIAETVAPAVLFIDELEKAFAGVGAGSLDSGVMDRIFGTFLTWMNDKTAPVFVVAAANKIEGLPPEFLRKGRFDEVWFVGLPTYEERVAILKNHCKKCSIQASDAVLMRVATETEGYSGAELGAITAEMQKHLFINLSDEALESDELVPLVADMPTFVQLAKATVPLSKSRKADIDAMTKWGNEHARMASRQQKPQTEAKRATRSFNRNVGIDLN